MGNHEGKQLTYSESVVIPKELESLSINGDNNPIIDGSSIKGSNNAAFLIKAETVRISNLTVKNFIGGSIDELGVKGGAAFAFTLGLKDARLERNTIENCNYGMIFNQNQSLRISGNTLKGFPSVEKNNPKAGGVGIMIFTDNQYIQDNHIGDKSPNSISGAEYAAIYVGSEQTLAFADFTRISNNIIKDNANGFGIVMSSLEGSCILSGNVFEGNKTAIFLKKDNHDTFIEKNTFKGSVGSAEIITDESYSGGMLYSIWKHFENIFEKPTYAKIEQEGYDSIIDSDKLRYIRTNQADAEKDGGSNGVLAK
jgi:nitrous oxidase accessory protein NosD